MVNIITVHGTFAGDEQFMGNKWWQFGSPFFNQFKDLSNDRVVVIPFHWTGENSEDERRKAGCKLADLISRQKEPPIVVAHSHGGNAVIHALTDLIRKNEDCSSMIRGIVLIGTPVLFFRRVFSPFSWFSGSGRFGVLAILGVLLPRLIFTSFDVRNEAFSVGVLLRNIFINPSGLIAVIIILYLVLLLWRDAVRNAQHRNFLATGRHMKVLKNKLVLLRHHSDEAIQALNFVQQSKARYVEKDYLVNSIFWIICTIGFSYLFVLYGSYLIRGEAPFLSQYLWRLTEFHDLVIYGVRNADLPIELASAFEGMFGVLIFFLPAIIIVSIAFALSFLVGSFLSPVLSDVVSSTLKAKILGDDARTETVYKVTDNIHREHAGLIDLPSEVEEEMLSKSMADLPSLLAEFRQIIAGGILVGTNTGDLFAESLKFEKSELLHNGYFHSSKFISFFAALSVQRFGVEPSSQFLENPYAVKFLRGLRKLQAASVGCMEPTA